MWSCDLVLPYLTGGIVGFVVGIGLTLAWCRWNRRGGRIEVYRTFDYSQAGQANGEDVT